MNTDMNLTVHGVTAITTRCVWINGHWHREIVCRIGENGDQELKFVLNGEDRLALQEIPDQWVQVECGESRVDRSDKPFSSEFSAGERQ